MLETENAQTCSQVDYLLRGLQARVLAHLDAFGLGSDR